MGFFTVRLEADAVVLLDQRRLPEEEVYLRLASRRGSGARDRGHGGARRAGHRRDRGARRRARARARARRGARARRSSACRARLGRTRPDRGEPALGARAHARRARAALRARRRRRDELRAAARAAAQRIADEDVASCRAIGDAGAALLPARRARAHSLQRRCARDRGLRHRARRGAQRRARGAARGTWWRRRRARSCRARGSPRGSCRRTGSRCSSSPTRWAARSWRRRRIDVVVVGADRIAANGDVANKIGTYSAAILARAHGIPFYVAAPFSTVDLSLASGARDPDRAAQRRRGDHDRRAAHRPRGRGSAPSGLRRDPRELCDGHHHRAGRDPTAICAGSCGSKGPRPRPMTPLDTQPCPAGYRVVGSPDRRR